VDPVAAAARFPVPGCPDEPVGYIPSRRGTFMAIPSLLADQPRRYVGRRQR